jgi:hypothetical protein
LEDLLQIGIEREKATQKHEKEFEWIIETNPMKNEKRRKRTKPSSGIVFIEEDGISKKDHR